MSCWNNPRIEQIQKVQGGRDLAMKELQKQIDFIYLQQGVCYDKIKLYKAQQDAFKVLFWEDLLEQCETVRYRLQDERDAISKAWNKDQTEVVELMHQELNTRYSHLNTRLRNA